MNLGQIRQALQSLGYGTDTAGAQTDDINDAYRQIAGMFRWPWLEGQATVTATVGNPVVNLSSITDLRDIDAVRIESSTTNTPVIRYLAPQDFRDLEHVDRNNSQPQYWSYFNAQLHLWPRPDLAYTVTVDYIKTLTALVNDNDTPIFDPEFHDVLKWKAAQLIAFRERDTYSLQFAAGEFQDRIAQMRRHYGIRQRQNARTVQRSAFWDNVARVFE